MPELKLEKHAPGRYTVLQCPMPTFDAGTAGKCGSYLNVEWSLTAPVYLGDVLTPADATLSPEEAWTGAWSIICEDGHTILVPAEILPCQHGVQGEDCAGHDEDTDDSLRTVRTSDLVRLREVLLALGPVTDLAGVAQLLPSMVARADAGVPQASEAGQ